MDGDDDSGLSPDQLREKADRCFRLARHTIDVAVRASLVSYGRDLLNRADKMTERRD